ncbi:MAG: rubredoxin [Nitrospirae bacterium]|nr:rubredoxin [Nitrospirota bacterium]
MKISLHKTPFFDADPAEGVPFEALPSNWLCPICGVDKTEFVVW